jgi:hypothetical protein
MTSKVLLTPRCLPDCPPCSLTNMFFTLLRGGTVLRYFWSAVNRLPVTLQYAIPYCPTTVLHHDLKLVTGQDTKDTDPSNFGVSTVATPVYVLPQKPCSAQASTSASLVSSSCHMASTMVFIACMSLCYLNPEVELLAKVLLCDHYLGSEFHAEALGLCIEGRHHHL